MLLRLSIITPYTARVLVPVDAVQWWTPENPDKPEGPTKLRLKKDAAFPMYKEHHSGYDTQHLIVAEPISAIEAAMAAAGLDLVDPARFTGQGLD